MGNMVQNFIGFDGRLNRQAWWISVIILIVVAIVLNFILGAVMGTGMMMSPADLAQSGTLQKLALQSLIISVLTTYPYLAITIKRRHDRNNNGYDAAGLIILSILYNLAGAFGLISPTGTIAMIFGIVFLIYGIYILVQVGFLKGTPGANSYGPDPLGG